MKKLSLENVTLGSQTGQHFSGSLIVVVQLRGLQMLMWHLLSPLWHWQWTQSPSCQSVPFRYLSFVMDDKQKDLLTHWYLVQHFPGAFAVTFMGTGSSIELLHCGTVQKSGLHLHSLKGQQEAMLWASGTSVAL